MRRMKLSLLVLAFVLCVCLAWLDGVHQNALAAAQLDDAITGVVSSSNGPEVGVWVIAETDDLETRFRKIVVTDDAGRFLLPELPEARYTVWVRGYGLVDSAPATASVGEALNLTARVASTPREAAQVYPANYWYSLIEPPQASEFPGTGPAGNGINPGMQTIGAWVDLQKQGCMLCHQLGNKATREVADLERFDSMTAAWDHRVKVGQRGSSMSGMANRFGRERGLKMFADWSERIAGGEVPPQPPRPRGVERNVVLTMWDWGTPEAAYLHDEVATDKRDPRVNANGPVYGVDIGNDYLAVADPVRHTAYQLKIPLREDRSTVAPMFPSEGFEPSPFAGTRVVHDNPANPHNPMMDHKGRVWITTRIRSPQTPTWCRESENRFTQNFPLARSERQAGFFDPETREFVLIDTCYGTHHLQFTEDDDHTLYFSGGGQVVGWINTRMYDETGDEQASEGWCPTVLDTNGDGRITKPWNEPVGGGRAIAEGAGGGRLESFDPTLDTRVNVGSYGIVTNPVDDSAWIASTQFPGRIVRFVPGDNPPATCMSELYEVPSEVQPGIDYADSGFGPRGIDVDRNGVIWTALSGSSHFASFDRRRCRVLNGPTTAMGRHCNEGWTFYPTPGPNLKGTPYRADHHYYNWVDQFDTLGLGADIPIAAGSNSDSLLALLPETNEWFVLRVPYPLGFFTRGLDGRIDDPNAGWKGRGVWATYGASVTWHTELGYDGVSPSLVKFQVRPDPLAR